MNRRASEVHHLCQHHSLVLFWFSICQIYPIIWPLPTFSDEFETYCVGRSLGSGTFGKVRIGTHTITGEKVAIKILEKDRIKDKGDVERVTREINILKKVRHPNVI